MAKRGVQHWKKRKAIAAYLNKRQYLAHVSGLSPVTSAAIELLTESGLVLTTEAGEWLA